MTIQHNSFEVESESARKKDIYQLKAKNILKN